jgi:hypothetical protein
MPAPAPEEAAMSSTGRVSALLSLSLLLACQREAPPAQAPAAATQPPPAAEPAVAARSIDGFSAPESVAAAGTRRFVSNLGDGGDPLAKDGNGFISELDANGTLVALRAFPKQGDTLHAPKGMAVIGDRLYATDVDRVVGFDLVTGALAYEAPLGGGEPAFLNDLAVDSDATLLATDTSRGRLYRLDLASKAFTSLAEGIAGANGVVVDAARSMAYVNGIGKRFEGGDLYAVPLAGEGRAPKQRIGDVHGVFDGVALVGDELWLSDWKSVAEPKAGVVHRHALDGTFIAAIDAPPLQGPADFAVDPASGDLWIPEMPANRLTILAPKN